MTALAISEGTRQIVFNLASSPLFYVPALTGALVALALGLHVLLTRR